MTLALFFVSIELTRAMLDLLVWTIMMKILHSVHAQREPCKVHELLYVVATV